MPQLYFKVAETATRVIDPVVEQIKNTLIDQFGIAAYFAGNQFIDNDRFAPTDDTDTQGNMRFGNNRMDVEVETHYNPSSQLWDMTVPHNHGAYGQSTMFANQYESVFNDPAVGVSVQELTVPFGLTLTFKLQLLTYDAAQNILDAILASSHGELVNRVHDLTYSYPVPLTMMAALYCVYKNRSSLQDMGFQAYLKNFSSDRFGLDVLKYDLGKPNPETQMVAHKVQMNCIAQLTCDQDKPEVEKTEMANAWYNLEFTYKIQFGRPQRLQVTLPVAVENQPLPPYMFEKSFKGYYDHLVGSMQTKSFNSVMRHLGASTDMSATLIRMPEYDDWVPRNSIVRKYKYSAIMIAVLQMNPGGPTTVSLNDLGDVALSDEVKTILSQSTADDVFGLEGLFNISVFSNNAPVDRFNMDFDPDTLTVSVNATQKINIYRIVLSEAMDIRTVNPKWYPTVLQYRYYFPMTIMRSLDYLISIGTYAVTPDQGLLSLIRKVKSRGIFDNILEAMVNAGRVDNKIYQYTQTTEQFADYITNTRPHVFETDPPDMVDSLTLFDVFCAICIQIKMLTPENVPQKYLRTPKGYPYGQGQGGFYDFNLPVRMWRVNIERN